jgi:hypothetical protein
MSITFVRMGGIIGASLEPTAMHAIHNGGSVRVKLGRWFFLLLCSGGSLALMTGSAQAAATATALPAQYVTAHTALLRGTIRTGGQQTLWQFQYGRGKNYGSYTRPRGIPAGRGTVAVSLRLTGLDSHTRYHFRLLVQQGPGTISFPIFLSFGSDRSFLTQKTSNLGLGPTTLVFPNRYAPVSLYCASSGTCQAALEISYSKPGTHHKVLTLGKRRITLSGRHNGTFSVRLDNEALELLKHNGNQLDSTLTLTSSAGKAKLTSPVTLIRS